MSADNVTPFPPSPKADLRKQLREVDQRLEALDPAIAAAIRGDAPKSECIEPERPSHSTTVPGFPAVDVIAYSDDDQKPPLVNLTYYGWPDDLVAAGLLPRQAFVMGSRRKRGARVDQDGTRWRVTSHWRQKDSGRRSRYFRIDCVKPLPLGRRWPGANEALEVAAHCRRWEEERDRDRQAREARLSTALSQLKGQGVDPREPLLKAMARLGRTTTLRLIVDNTRGEGSPP